MKEKRRTIISVVLALIFVVAAAITATACSGKNAVKRQLPPGFTENAVNPLEGKNLQTPEIKGEMVNNEYRRYFEYDMQTYYLTNKVFKIQDNQEILIGEIISYFGSFKANGIESRSKREAHYLYGNYIYMGEDAVNVLVQIVLLLENTKQSVST